jgi:lipoprotein-anchoring transpeptidase ErfK/SrfK
MGLNAHCENYMNRRTVAVLTLLVGMIMWIFAGGAATAETAHRFLDPVTKLWLEFRIPATAASRLPSNAPQRDSDAPRRHSKTPQRPSNVSPIKREIVTYAAPYAPGTIVIDPQGRYLYLVEPAGRAMRYGVGVGREGFAWSGMATINSKQEWPDWYPPKEMFERQPELLAKMSQLQSGLGVPGGPGNPLGARALYLWQNGNDTLYRIHGTFEPWTIGKNVSSGCIRMINQDVIDLYARTAVGEEVVVLPAQVG